MTWSTLELPTSVRRAVAGAVGGRVFVFSGDPEAGIASTPEVQILDPVTRAFTIVPLPWTARWTFFDVVSDDRWICSIGGGWPIHNHLDIYDSWTDTWTHTTTAASDWSQGALVDGKLYILNSAAQPPTNEGMQIFDLETMTSTTVPRPSDPGLQDVLAIEPYVAMVGGGSPGTTATQPTSQFAELYNTWTGEWHLVDLEAGLGSRAKVSVPETGQMVLAGGVISGVGVNPGPSARIDILTIEQDIGSSFCAVSPPNSTGQQATMRAVGSSSVEDDLLTIAVENAPPGQVGMFFVSTQSGVLMNPGGYPGTLCVGAGFGRVMSPRVIVDSNGRLAATLTLGALPIAVPQPASAGDTLYVQAAFRDSLPGQAVGFSDALSITLTP